MNTGARKKNGRLCEGVENGGGGRWQKEKELVEGSGEEGGRQ